MSVERLEYNKKSTSYNDLSVEEDPEQKIWIGLSAYAWETSITDGFFSSLYGDTVWYLRRLIDEYRLNMIMEVGCGTGQIIESVSAMINDSNLECLGLDINPEFIDHCKNASQGKTSVQYFVADATKLEAWTSVMLPKRKRQSLVCCVNNTLSIMPEEIRPACVHQMRTVAGRNGIVFLSYWNGAKFRQGLIHYYKKNPQLCGDFDLAAQDFDRRKLLTDSGYTSHWPYENEVEQMLRCYGIPVRDILEVKTVGKGVFCVLRGAGPIPHARL